MELNERIEDLDRHGILFSIFTSLTILLAMNTYLSYPPLFMATGDSVNPQPTYQLPAWFLYTLIILLPATAVAAYVIDLSKRRLLTLFLGILFLLLLFGVVLFDFSAFLFNFAQDWSLIGIIFKTLIVGQFIWTLFNVGGGAKRVYYDISGCPPPKEGTMVSDRSRKSYTVNYKSNIGKKLRK